MNADSVKIKKRYNRIAPIFDAIEGLMEFAFFRNWRKLVWQKTEGKNILEVGVGTGKNFPFYPSGAAITAIDFSDKMLDRAKQKADKLGTEVHLQLMDIESLKFADHTFDTVVATFVFCSVPDPIQGLDEIKRVCNPGGKIVLLEHVLSSNALLAAFMNLLNPIVVRLFGANINRKTLETVRRAGFKPIRINELSGDIVKLIEAWKTADSP